MSSTSNILENFDAENASSFVEAATHHLEIKVKELEDRRNMLEDALAVAYKRESDSTHPLLREENANKHDRELSLASKEKEEEENSNNKKRYK